MLKKIFISTLLLGLFIISCSNSNSSSTSSVLMTAYTIPTNYTVPPNPITNAPTPLEYNYSVFTRYYYSQEPKDIKAVLILMPGIFMGAGGFDKMAKSLVAMSHGNIEVWTVDRRSVLLDDRTGLISAWNNHDPAIAYNYYFNNASVNGKTFAGFVTPSTITYMSEWGLDMTLRDLNTIVSLIPPQYRKTNVFVGGHSLGAWLSEDYAAYDFDGNPSTTSDAGYNQIAGLILIDGGGSGLFQTMTSSDYISTQTGNSIELSGFTIPIPGLYQIRSTPDNVLAASLFNYISPSLGSMVNKLLVFFEIEGLYDYFEPNVQTTLLKDPVFSLIAALLYGNTQFKATNQAMLGFTIDRHFNPISILIGTLGSANGPLKTATNALFPGVTISQPTDQGTMIYTWNSAGHITYINDLAAALSNTYTSFFEWYFPLRLALDVLSMGDDYGVRGTSDWRWQQGMYVIHTPQMDAPVLALGGGSGLEQTDTVFYKYRDMLPSARNCNNQLRTSCGFDIHIMPMHTHLDMLLSDPNVSKLDSIMYNWIESHVSTTMPVPNLK